MSSGRFQRCSFIRWNINSAPRNLWIEGAIGGHTRNAEVLSNFNFGETIISELSNFLIVHLLFPASVDTPLFGGINPGRLPVADDFQLVFEPGNLRRIDRALAITAQSDNPAGMLSGDLFGTVRAPIEAIALPPGYGFEWKGEFGGAHEANAGLASTMPLGFGAMIVVVLLLFNAIRQPLIIFLTVPLALIGVVLAWCSRKPHWSS